MFLLKTIHDIKSFAGALIWLLCTGYGGFMYECTLSEKNNGKHFFLFFTRSVNHLLYYVFGENK